MTYGVILTNTIIIVIIIIMINFKFRQAYLFSIDNSSILH